MTLTSRAIHEQFAFAATLISGSLFLTGCLCLQRGIADVMAKTNAEEHNGKFLQFDGAVLPW